jgi:hypothetical protein
VHTSNLPLELRTAAYGIFPLRAKLEEVIASLNAAGFDNSSICVFLSPSHPIADDLRHLKTPYVNLSREADLESTVSWLSKFGGFVIPGVGLFVGSRNYLPALTQVDSRANRSGNRGMLQNLGISEEMAAHYDARLRHDATLVFVNCDGWAQSEWAREILRRLQAEEVSLLSDFAGAMQTTSQATGLVA